MVTYFYKMLYYLLILSMARRNNKVHGKIAKYYFYQTLSIYLDLNELQSNYVVHNQ